MNRSKVFLLFIFWFGLSSSAWAIEVENKDGYILGVFPYLSPVRMSEIYSPVSSELTSELNRVVKFRTSSTHKKFLKKLKNELYDLVLIQPFWFPEAVDNLNYVPLLKVEEPFSSLIMVLDDSPIRTVEDLKGKVIATPPAFVPVVQLAKRALIQHGVMPGKDVVLEEYKSVDSCFQQVLIGRASACISPPYVPAIIEKSMNIKLRAVLKSSAIPSIALIAHERVSVKDRERICKLFESWSGTDKGKSLLSAMQTKGFVAIKDNEYDVVREFVKERHH